MDKKLYKIVRSYVNMKRTFRWVQPSSMPWVKVCLLSSQFPFHSHQHMTVEYHHINTSTKHIPQRGHLGESNQPSLKIPDSYELTVSISFITVGIKPQTTILTYECGFCFSVWPIFIAAYLSIWPMRIFYAMDVAQGGIWCLVPDCQYKY